MKTAPCNSRCAAECLSGRKVATIRKRLLRWFDLHKRDLPWRRMSDPYRIWVSEIMLQQTRAQAVIPYYHSFLEKFPDVTALASASEDAVLAAWSGLGYYSRARNMRQAAQLMVRQHGGKFPDNEAAALALPGIGKYTAAAVLSIAYGVPLPVLDGNAARVLSRLCALRADLHSSSSQKTLRRLAGALLDTRRPGDFNQALMELGAMICTPARPECGQCPLRRTCRAAAAGSASFFPAPRCKQGESVRHFHAFLITDRRGRWLMLRRPSSARWMKGMWELPMEETAAGPLLARQIITVSGLRLRVLKSLGSFRHSITNNRITVEVYAAELSQPKPRRAGWIAEEDLGQLPITTMSRKSLDLARRGASP